MPAIVDRPTGNLQPGRPWKMRMGVDEGRPRGGSYLDYGSRDQQLADRGYTGPSSPYAPGGSSYGTRARGQAIRDDYSQAAGEAGALSGAAPNTPNIQDDHQGQSIRDNAIAAAQQQTVMHYDIRRGMAQDADQAAENRDRRVAVLADLALKKQMHLADTVLRQQGLDQEDRQLDQQGKYQQETMDVNREELAARQAEGAEGRTVEREKMAYDRKKDTAEGLGKAFDRLEARGDKKYDRALKEKELTLDDRRITAAEEYNLGRLDVQQQGANTARMNARRQAEAAGIDMSAYDDDFGGNTGGGGFGGNTGGLVDVATPAFAVASEGKPGTMQNAMSRGNPPEQGAEYDDEIGAWMVQRNGRWVKARR